MKKLAFFDQKHGLTPLENGDFWTAFFNQKRGLTPLKKWNFWDFQNFLFLLSKKGSFVSRTLFNLISSLILSQTK